MGFANATLPTVAALVLGFTVVSTAEGISLAYGTVSKTFAMRVSNSLEIEVLVDNQIVYRITNFFLLPQVSFTYETLSVGQVGLFLATYGVGLTAILTFLLAKTTVQGAATAGLLAIKEAITTIRPWFDFLETMQTLHTLMILTWIILGGILV